MSNANKIIAVAIGDPNGIGPEIAIKAAAELAAGDGPRALLVGDPGVIRHYAAMVAPALPLVEGDAPAQGALTFHAVANLAPEHFAPGRIEAAAGKAMTEYVAAAMRLVHEGKAYAIVGCPHNETAVHRAGIPFSGYPSLIARLSNAPEDSVFMMFIGGGLRIVHATLHERLADGLARLSTDLVVAAALAANHALQRMGVAKPKIGLFGINPHAGENGLFGDDDERINVPAAARLRELGVDVEGPLGADLLIGRREFDAFVAMYHDQGHIPVKLLAGRVASALSIGGGVIFSSTGHGSAFDIAGKGIADPEATLRAIRLVAGAPLTAP
jgi:4-hydroxythreonine-4-phosphate dehydrogenase